MNDDDLVADEPVEDLRGQPGPIPSATWIACSPRSTTASSARLNPRIRIVARSRLRSSKAIRALLQTTPTAMVAAKSARMPEELRELRHVHVGGDPEEVVDERRDAHSDSSVK